ncbi:aldo/keto reductase [Stakelama tenebrarum]|uniref:Aldo/keto reductase n=1 Tax=Stakelama tenebrarum TaxID=2711215 RepID=A0A6G6Y2E2_9SPHN|nr:aldo/keto reductase [Sphingosinithalassobacter tenebrarum]QIG79011.1 aldo/keto reductase [Sphingosinithalassobacter tenebrarum]
MEYRFLGRSGLKVSSFTFGTMTFGDNPAGSPVGTTGIAEAKKQIDLCLDAGVNLFDTADAYAAGRSESLLGEALGPRRRDVLIATKFVGPTGPGVNDLGASRHHIIEACEASLRRLNTDWIDLYQIHNQDLVTPPEETLRALDDLVRAGKVRYIGSSNHAGWTMMRALATSDRLGLERYVAQQIQYSLLRREAEDELLPLGHAEGVGAIIWSPLAAGYLSGKYRDGDSADQARLIANNMLDDRDTDQARRIVDTLAEIAAEHDGASISQVALNWAVRRGGVASVLIGARTVAQLTDNLAAAGWALSDEEISRLDTVSARPLRYPYDMHRNFMADRNPLPQLLPPIAS